MMVFLKDLFEFFFFLHFFEKNQITNKNLQNYPTCTGFMGQLRCSNHWFYHSGADIYTGSKTVINELRYEKTCILLCKTKGADQHHAADKHLCFRYTVESLYFLQLNFPAFDHLM